MNSPTDRYDDFDERDINVKVLAPPHSTLEVDTNARDPRGFSARADQWAPEVNRHATADQSYPEVIGGGSSYAASTPEAVGYAASSRDYLAYHENKPGAPIDGGGHVMSPTERRICGARPRTFWIALAVAAVVVIGIVAGVVGGVLSNRSSSSATENDSAGSSDSAGNSSASDTAAIGLHANTALASANFTDRFGNENYLVAYQLKDRSVYMSAWNASGTTWVVSPIIANGSDVQEGSSLSLDTFYHSDSDIDVHLYYQTPAFDDKVFVGSLIYRGNKHLDTTAPAPADAWEESSGVDQAFAAAGSSIVSYGKQCAFCNQFTYFYTQKPQGALAAWNTQNTTTGWQSQEVVDAAGGGVTPAANTPMALAHAAAAGADGHRSMNVFFRSETGQLAQLVDGDGRRTTFAIRGYLGANASIAAFSTGFNETAAADYPTPLGFQVLTADPGSDGDDSGGVQLTYYKDGKWAVASGEDGGSSSGGGAVGALAECGTRAVLAANAARRLYCLVDSGTTAADDEEEDDDDGNGGLPQIVEFRWKGDPADTGTYGDWERVGVVDTGVN
ncbi:hypothetical protein F4778DRAFT_732154 [Xylariomycetidae sp. FL2044]|nr:hypothetical protein F4778DRAFT_732154 [Xylariomycetidae sp. FL2044]